MSELFRDAKGYATRESAMRVLQKHVPDYETMRWMMCSLPNGRFLPVLQVSNTEHAQFMMYFVQKLGVM